MRSVSGGDVVGGENRVLISKEKASATELPLIEVIVKVISAVETCPTHSPDVISPVRGVQVKVDPMGSACAVEMS